MTKKNRRGQLFLIISHDLINDEQILSVFVLLIYNNLLINERILRAFSVTSYNVFIYLLGECILIERTKVGMRDILVGIEGKKKRRREQGWWIIMKERYPRGYGNDWKSTEALPGDYLGFSGQNPMHKLLPARTSSFYVSTITRESGVI